MHSFPMHGSNFNLYRRKDGIGNIVVLSFRDEAAKKGKESSTSTKIRARNDTDREREKKKNEKKRKIIKINVSSEEISFRQARARLLNA